MKIKHIKTYLMHGQIDLSDTYEIKLDKDKFKKYKEENDIDKTITVKELLEDERPLNFNKSYFNNSVSFKLLQVKKYDDDYYNNDLELIDEKITFI
jgi:hypothetical protein